MTRALCITDRRYLRQVMPGAMVEALRARGATVEVLVPSDCRFEPASGEVTRSDGPAVDLRGFDVVVCRSRGPLGLAILAYAEAAGLPTVNRYTATRAVRDKVEMAITLGQAGLPCAATYLTDHVASLAELPAGSFPLILKATFGDNSQGLRLVRRPEDLHDVHWGEDVVVAQHYVPNDGFDLKLYVCGPRVFAVRKPSPFNGDPRAPTTAVRTDRRLAELALRCGEVFGLEVYGVDTVDTPDGPVVIEVNEFPNFTGVADAGALVADHVLSKARR